MSKKTRTAQRRPIPTGIQFFSILLFAGFAISTAIVAMTEFWPAGVGLAAFYAYQWSRIPTLSGGYNVSEAVASVVPGAPEPAKDRSSGNATFDAYKDELLERLEKEQTNFENFLTRLRAAKDEAEFDRFMEDRAEAARNMTGAVSGTVSETVTETVADTTTDSDPAEKPAAKPDATPELREPA